MNLSEDNIRQILPRLLRLRDAPDYVGMDRNRFNTDVRPFLTELPIGKQGIAFDRLELDAWVEDYKSRIGRPGRLKGETIWDVKDRQVSSIEKGPGTSISASEGGEFARALVQLASKKPSGS
jgi:hypothetical protein